MLFTTLPTTKGPHFIGLPTNQTGLIRTYFNMMSTFCNMGQQITVYTKK